MKRFYPDGCCPFKDDNTPFHRAWLLNNWFEFESENAKIITVSRSQPKTTTIIKIAIKRISFGRMLFIPPVQLQKLIESMPRSIECVLAVHGGLTKLLPNGRINKQAWKAWKSYLRIYVFCLIQYDFFLSLKCSTIEKVNETRPITRLQGSA